MILTGWVIILFYVHSWGYGGTSRWCQAFNNPAGHSTMLNQRQTHERVQ